MLTDGLASLRFASVENMITFHSSRLYHIRNSLLCVLAEKFLGQTSGLQDVVRITSLCLRAKFQPDQETVSVNTRKIEGDASESAILRFLTITFEDITWWREKNPPLVEIPFNSTTKFQVSVHRMEETGRHLLVMKGAPEIIFSRCSTVLCDGKEMPKDRIWKEKFDDAYAEFGHLGERVLGMCDYELPAEEFPEDFVFDTEHVNFPLDGLRFIGLISMLVRSQGVFRDS